MGKTLPEGFYNYLQAWSGRRDQLFSDEIKRLYGLPGVHKALDKFAPEERHAHVEKQAAMNAEALAEQELMDKRAKYGITELTPDVVRQTAAARAATAPGPSQETQALAAQHGHDAWADYKAANEQQINDLLGRLEAQKLPYDQPPQQTTQTPIVSPAGASAGSQPQAEPPPQEAPVSSPEQPSSTPIDPMFQRLANTVGNPAQAVEQAREDAAPPPPGPTMAGDANGTGT